MEKKQRKLNEASLHVIEKKGAEFKIGKKCTRSGFEGSLLGNKILRTWKYYQILILQTRHSKQI